MSRPIRSRILWFAAFSACLALWTYGSSSGSASPQESFHFTVTSDIHLNTTTYGKVLDAMQAHSGGQGAFQVSIGDVVNSTQQSPQPVRDLIDARLGAGTLWFPALGNHDASSSVPGGAAVIWRRDEFNTGHGVRTPLKDIVKNPGPTGCRETTYSWDSGNAHCIVLNEYYTGTADSGGKGDIIPQLLAWLESDLAANTKPFIFVFGHEPAFAQHRHVGDSLDAYPANRNAFWNVLAKYKVQAFFSGHVHFYYKEQHQGVWQISDGNAGNGTDEGHQTYLDVIVRQDGADVKVWQNDSDGGAVWHLAETIPLLAGRTTWNFDDVRVGELPAGFVAAEGQWAVAEDPGAVSGKRVLAQTASDTFPRVVQPTPKFGDFAASVSFKPVSGTADANGGLLFRVKDADNGYLVRATATETNLRLYKIVDGKRTKIASAEPIPALVMGTWHTLKVVVRGHCIKASLDDKELITFEDATFPDPGGIGLWTKADSVTYFDNLEARALGAGDSGSP